MSRDMKNRGKKRGITRKGPWGGCVSFLSGEFRLRLWPLFSGTGSLFPSDPDFLFSILFVFKTQIFISELFYLRSTLACMKS